ncbi:MAG: PD40 domain-containing protein, partial [candidate division Zixibacteria bacterium]|nr:PD40 domain-containing protein [candidate division Zixibacteria bacterium]
MKMTRVIWKVLSFRMQVITIPLLLAISLGTIFPAQTEAQEIYFGKNKVIYRDFEWTYIQSKHFDIYYYDEQYDLARFSAQVLEDAYDQITEELDYTLRSRVPIFIYLSHNDFQQTNITSGLLPEGVGGFTEAFKKRIVIPFTGSYEDYRHVLHHELTHAVIYDMLFGSSLSSILSRQRLFNLPLWFAEGYAEFSSRGGWDYWSDMIVRDATINNYLQPPEYMGGYLAYKEGQAFIGFIVEKYGVDKLGEILRKGKATLSMSRATNSALGEKLGKVWQEFSLEMKKRYWPEIAKRQTPKAFAKPLTNHKKDGSFFNQKPTFSPTENHLAIFTDRSDYTEIFLISAKDGSKISKLTKASRSGDLESLHSYLSGISFSPDGKNIVFVAKSEGYDALFFMDVHSKKTYLKKRIESSGLLSPSWSPDGKSIAFAQLSAGHRDIAVYNIESD